MHRCRSASILIWLVATLCALATAPRQGAGQGEAPGMPANFDPFLQELWPDAHSRGVDRVIFDQAFAGVVPDARVIAATRRQPEYGKPVSSYVGSIASKERIALGQRKATEWSETFRAVEERFAVDRWTILGLWGIESSFGQDRDSWDVIRSLATLAQARYRHPYFRDELLVALSILQKGPITREHMLGSWAGAMGQPQFMPSNFLDYAVDFSGHGWSDIWNNVPDVLASIAYYLQKEGWISDLSPAFEVIVPQGFDYRRSHASFVQWQQLGLRRPDNREFPANGAGILFFPTGATGPAFLVTPNFDVIKRYNDSDVYALAAMHLADRIRGLPPIQASWPADDYQLSRDQRIALQRKLAELGYSVRDFEGHFDFELRDAIRDIQAQYKMLSDGHPTPALIERLGIR